MLTLNTSSSTVAPIQPQQQRDKLARTNNERRQREKDRKIQNMIESKKLERREMFNYASHNRAMGKITRNTFKMN